MMNPPSTKGPDTCPLKKKALVLIYPLRNANKATRQIQASGHIWIIITHVQGRTWKQDLETAKQLSRFYGNSMVVQSIVVFLKSSCTQTVSQVDNPATFRPGNPRGLYYSARSRAECIQSCNALDTWDWKNPWVHMPTLYTHPAKIMFALALGSLSQIGIKLLKHATFLRSLVNHGLNESPIQHGELSPPKAQRTLWLRTSFRQTSSRDS